MHEITALIIAFIFVGIVFPALVKNLPLFYAALALALVAILLDAVSGGFSGGFSRFTYFVEGVLDIIAILILVMATGGQTLGQLAGEMGKSIDAVRQSAAPTQPSAPPVTPAPGGGATAPSAKTRNIAMPPRKAQGDSSIPMD